MSAVGGAERGAGSITGISPSGGTDVNTVEHGRLVELLARFERQRVTILGDLMLDRYVWGEVDRISPEAPVPVVAVREETSRFGGAANVAENVAALGAKARVLGVVGDDAAGAELRSLLSERGVDVDGVRVVPDRPTTTKTRIIAHGQQVVRTDREKPHDISRDDEEAVIVALTAALGTSDVLIISDYGKGVLTERVLSVGISAARKERKEICVDPKESRFLEYVGVTAITPNQKEAGAALGVTVTDTESLERVGWELQRRLDAGCVLITRGEQGMAIFVKGGELVLLPTVAREVYDVTGAGDTVVSVLAVALGAGATNVEAAIISNHAAGVVIREIGTASVTTPEIERSFALG